LSHNYVCMEKYISERLNVILLRRSVIIDWLRLHVTSLLLCRQVHWKAGSRFIHVRAWQRTRTLERNACCSATTDQSMARDHLAALIRTARPTVDHRSLYVVLQCVAMRNLNKLQLFETRSLLNDSCRKERHLHGMYVIIVMNRAPLTFDEWPVENGRKTSISVSSMCIVFTTIPSCYLWYDKLTYNVISYNIIYN